MSTRFLPTALLAVALVLPGGAFAQTQEPATTPAPGRSVGEETELDRRTREVSSHLRCPVCQGLSIQDSPSEMAQDMRAVVREQLAAGKSPDEVKEFFVQGYGEWVLLQPRAEGFNLAVYLLPVAVLLGGAAFVVVLTRRWTRRSSVDDAPAPHPEEDPDLAPWDEAAHR